MTNREKVLNDLMKCSTDKLAEIFVWECGVDEEGYALYTGHFDGKTRDWSAAVRAEKRWLEGEAK